MVNLARLNNETKLHPTQSNSPQDLDRHRKEIGFLCEVTYEKMGKFGWGDLAMTKKAMILKDWMDALSQFSIDDIDKARREFTKTRPDKIPNEGHIRELIMSNRSKASRRGIPKHVEPEPNERVTQEAADDILAKAGFGGLVKGMPK